MTIKVRDTPGAICIAIEARGFAQPIGRIIFVALLAIMLLVFYVNNTALIQNQTSLQAVSAQSAPHQSSHSSDLIPVFTGGLGASTSLGGNSSLGGGSHYKTSTIRVGQE